MPFSGRQNSGFLRIPGPEVSATGFENRACSQNLSTHEIQKGARNIEFASIDATKPPVEGSPRETKLCKRDQHGRLYRLVKLEQTYSSRALLVALPPKD
jgi:hypothetical protein